MSSSSRSSGWGQGEGQSDWRGFQELALDRICRTNTVFCWDCMCVSVYPWDWRWFRTPCFGDMLFWSEWPADPMIQMMVSMRDLTFLLLALPQAVPGVSRGYSEIGLPPLFSWVRYLLLRIQLPEQQTCFPPNFLVTLIIKMFWLNNLHWALMLSDIHLVNTISCWGPVHPIRKATGVLVSWTAVPG